MQVLIWLFLKEWHHAWTCNKSSLQNSYCLHNFPQVIYSRVHLTKCYWSIDLIDTPRSCTFLTNTFYFFIFLYNSQSLLKLTLFPSYAKSGKNLNISWHEKNGSLTFIDYASWVIKASSFCKQQLGNVKSAILSVISDNLSNVSEETENKVWIWDGRRCNYTFFRKSSCIWPPENSFILRN